MNDALDERNVKELRFGGLDDRGSSCPLIPLDCGKSSETPSYPLSNAPFRFRECEDK
jgi:hypothetical protein